MSHNDGIPAYLITRRKILSMLESMHVGERLPTERELSKQFDISRVTLRKALDELRKEDIIKARSRLGTVLAKRVEPEIKDQYLSTKKLIGLILPSLENTMIIGTMRGAVREAEKLGIHITISCNDEDPARLISCMRSLFDLKPFGIIINPGSSSIENESFLLLLERAAKERIRIVMSPRAPSSIDLPCVRTDDVDGVFKAVSHLVKQGRKRLALLGLDTATGGDLSIDRRRGFEKALEEFGISRNMTKCADMPLCNHEEKARETVSRWISEAGGKATFDGLVCMQDNIAYGAYLALRDAGISVPKDVAIIGYDNLNLDIYKAAGLHLSSIAQPNELIGAEYVRILTDKNGYTSNSGRTVLLKCGLVQRDSSTCGDRK